MCKSIHNGGKCERPLIRQSHAFACHLPPRGEGRKMTRLRVASNRRADWQVVLCARGARASSQGLCPKMKNHQLSWWVTFICAFHSACLWSNDMRGDCNARRSKELFVGVGLPTVAFGMSVVFSMTKANIFSGMM